jgi:hypothetical protein
MLLIILAALTAPAPDAFDRMNQLRGLPACKSILQQVAGENRPYHGTRLDQQPPGHLLFAVDRQINGCHQATFVRGERRR